jgi:hypothetical protein
MWNKMLEQVVVVQMTLCPTLPDPFLSCHPSIHLKELFLNSEPYCLFLMLYNLFNRIYIYSASCVGRAVTFNKSLDKPFKALHNNDQKSRIFRNAEDAYCVLERPRFSSVVFVRL